MDLPLSIITVVKNDYKGLVSTINSLNFVKPKRNYEHIVWINSNSVLSKKEIEFIKKRSDLLIIEKDKGIFDAMNKALKKTKGKYILFLNAKDIFIKQFTIRKNIRPCIIPIVYSNFQKKDVFLKPKKSIAMGIPYCHQGLILPKKDYKLDSKKKFGSDYEAFLNLRLKWPLPFTSDGFIRYDTTGISSLNRWESDKATAKIIYEKFGYFYFSLFLTRSVIKLIIKFIYRRISFLFNKK